MSGPAFQYVNSEGGGVNTRFDFAAPVGFGESVSPASRNIGNSQSVASSYNEPHSKHGVPHAGSAHSHQGHEHKGHEMQGHQSLVNDNAHKVDPSSFGHLSPSESAHHSKHPDSDAAHRFEANSFSGRHFYSNSTGSLVR